MKAAPMTLRPNFPLMTQADIVSFFHLQMPRWLFTHQSYKTLSLEAKVAYTFLLNRFQLSRLNGWINDAGEVFVIFTRESLAKEMQISYRKAIECFKELSAVNLIWERRPGRGDANQIYLALVRLDENDALGHSSAPFGCGEAEENKDAARPAGSALQGTRPQSARPAKNAYQDHADPPILMCENSISAPSDPAVQELPVLHPSKTESKLDQKEKIDFSENKVSQSVWKSTPGEAGFDGHADELERIIENCELYIFPPEVAGVFRNAVERLYYSSSFTLNGACLPQEKIRSHLWELNGCILQDTLAKLRSNREKKVKNSTAYVMAVILNAIWESESDLLVDPYLNSLAAVPGKEEL